MIGLALKPAASPFPTEPPRETANQKTLLGTVNSGIMGVPTKASWQMLEEMLDKWRRGPRGPLPQLTTLQLLSSLLLIDREGPVGRRTLSQLLSIKNGVARGLAERLSEQGIVEVTETGVRLSKEGKNRLRGVLRQMSIQKISNLDKTEMVPGRAAVSVHLSNQYQPRMTGIQQRDEAVKAGADGCITLAVKNGKLIVPPDEKDAADLYPKENSRLRNLFKLSDNDLVIIGFGDNQQRAMAGALAAVLSLSKP